MMASFKKLGLYLVGVSLAVSGLNACSQERHVPGRDNKVKSFPDREDAGKQPVKESRAAARKNRTWLEKKKKEWASGSK